MQSSGPSSSRSRFDPLRLLSEIQAEPAASRPDNDSSTEVVDDDDFMSDKYLVTSEPKQPLTYTDKRRKLEAHRSSKTKPIKQSEEEAREEGLGRDLLAEAEIVAGGGRLPPEEGGVRRWDLLEKEASGGNAREGGEDGTAKAMRMMLAMGYRRGEALGRRTTGTAAASEQEEEDEEEEDEEEAHPTTTSPLTMPPDEPPTLTADEQLDLQQDLRASQAREEDEYLTGGVSASSLRLPMRTTEPLRPDQRWLGVNRRAGIGSLPKPPADVSRAILAKASSPPPTTTEDFRTRIAQQHAQRHTANLLSRARTTLLHLDQAHGVPYNPLWLDPDLYLRISGLSIQHIDEAMRSDPSLQPAIELLQLAFSHQELEREAKTFVDLPAKAQLELTLDRLRIAHAYCLFCGYQYSSAQELAQLCPGTTEDDHD